MCAKRFFLLSACFCLLAVSLHSEQWYRISEMELSKLEKISQNWEIDRQNLLSQVSGLKQTADRLQQDSRTLNGQLQTERAVRSTLQKSFEQSEADRLKKLSEYETELAALRKTASDSEISALKMQNQRNALLFLLAGTAFATVSFAAFKLKKLFM